MLGAPYTGRGAISYETRLAVVDQAWVPTTFARRPVYMYSADFPLGLWNVAELSRAFRYVDVAVRPWLFERHLPDAPRPTLSESPAAPEWTATLADGTLQWRDGAARIGLRWQGPPP